MTVVAVAGPEIPAFPAVAEPVMIQPSNGPKSPATGTPPASIRPVADCRLPQKSMENQRFLPGVAYYGYRWYDPATGRWPSREPIGEAGSLNLYSFIGNNGTTDFDILGLCSGSRKALLDAACKAQKETEKQGVEFCAAICCKDGKYTQTKWNRGTKMGCMVPNCPKDQVKVRDLHSHPGVDGSPSGTKPGDRKRPPGDTDHAVDKNVDYWLVTDAPFSNNDDEVWMVKYNRNGSLGDWIYNCKTGEFKPRQ
jgi:RHS repeat-associated protein